MLAQTRAYAGSFLVTSDNASCKSDADFPYSRSTRSANLLFFQETVVVTGIVDLARIQATKKGGVCTRDEEAKPHLHLCLSPVPRPLPRKAERGSGVMNISCHMGRGLRSKECHVYILHPGLEFSDD